MSEQAWMLETLMKILNTESPTGYTDKVAALLEELLRGLSLRPWRTHKGNVVCELGGEGSPLVLAAHVDTLGAMVRSVKPNGRLRLSQIGGYPWTAIENENCKVFGWDGREYTGCIYLTTPSSHVYKGVGEVKRDDATLELVLDENLHSAEEVKALSIGAGCFVSLDPRAVLTPSGYIKSRHLDDKASSAILLRLAKAVAGGTLTPSRKLYLVFTVHEEVGHGACAGLPEDAVDILSVDMGCVGEDLGCDETMVSICAKDSRGPYNHAMTARLRELAEEKGIAYAVDLYPAYGSDADAALASGHNLRHALIGPGVFASHGYERGHVEGLENTYRLLEAFVQDTKTL